MLQSHFRKREALKVIKRLEKLFLTERICVENHKLGKVDTEIFFVSVATRDTH